MELAKQQGEAAQAVEAWLKEKSEPFFYLGGYAGTGKTTIAKHLAEMQKGRVAFGAYTGKAASVLNKKGIPASTIHSLIYQVIPPDETKAKELQKQLAGVTSPVEREKLKQQIRDIFQPRFTLAGDALEDISLIVIDEVSMVDEQVGQDLLSFGIPVLVLGDPGQLPPVTGEGFFTAGKPDYLLTDIHRQAAGNPIIGMATTVRQGGSLRAGRYGACEVIFRSKFERRMLLEFDQMICGRNATRKSLNDLYRDSKDLGGVVPTKGEKIICLKNNKELGILNGQQFYVHKVEDQGTYLDLDIHENPNFLEVDEKDFIQVSSHPFNADLKEMFWRDRLAFEEFDFGYAITCHKSQGSQWPTVLIQNESWCFREHAQKWLYTALTRAEEKVLVVL